MSRPNAAPPTHPDPSAAPPLVLGSSSRYRRELLARLLPHFEIVAPQVDETRLAGEAGAALATRLAAAKAAAVAALRPEAVVIGSDQVAECDGEILGKPGSVDNAVRQLLRSSGKALTLHTAVCVRAPGRAVGDAHLDRTLLHFHVLTPGAVARYVERDQPLDCAGGFRFEALGAALFREVDTRDPTAIQGLPLLWVAGALARAGIAVL